MFHPTKELRVYEAQILQGIDRKGWNLYLLTSLGQRSYEEGIRRGRVSSLTLMERYLIMPKADDPKDLDRVRDALKKLEARLQGIHPTIEIEGERFPWVGFRPRVTDVQVTTPIGHFIFYSDFIVALGSIVKV